MSNITKLDFMALDITGRNYLSWVLDAEIYLNAHGLGETILPGNEVSRQNKVKAMIFLRHHLYEGLKVEYLTVKDPLELWNNLKERFDHQKTMILPKAHFDWIHLRLHDFKSVAAYNSAIFKISSQLKLCGEKITDEGLLEKTFLTFHVSNVLLQQQYREKGFKKYSELISCLLVAEQNNELLMKNHESHPTGSTPFPEVNTVANKSTRCGRGCGQGRGCGFDHGRGRGDSNSHSKWAKNDKGYQKENNRHKNQVENLCYRSGERGHMSRTCHTPKHLVNLCQESLKNKNKNKGKESKFESNFVDKEGDFDFGDMDVIHLDISDFFADPNGKIDHLIGDGNVQK